MAKLEEISELLVSEIRDFEETVKKLEEIRKAKIAIDLTELKSIMENHQMELKKQNSAVQETFNKFSNLIKDAKIYPKWALITFMLSFVINGILIYLLITWF